VLSLCLLVLARLAPPSPQAGDVVPRQERMVQAALGDCPISTRSPADH